MSGGTSPDGGRCARHGPRHPGAPEDIAPFYTRIRRGRPPIARAAGRAGAALRRHRRDSRPWPSGPRPRWTALRPALARRGAGPLHRGLRGQAHRAPHRGRRRPSCDGPAWRDGHRPGAHPARLIHGLAGVPGPGRGGHRRARARFIPVPPWYAEPGPGGAPGRTGDRRPGRSRWPPARPAPLPGDLHRPLAAGAGADAGDTYPEQLEDSARLVAAAAGLARWQVAWQSAGRTPEPWLGPGRPRRRAPAGASRRVSTASWSAPSAS